MISKIEAQKNAEAQHQAAAMALEEKIDAAIRARWPSSIYIDIAGVPRPAVDAVKRKYIDGGWKVEESHDQRDGSALVLS